MEELKLSADVDQEAPYQSSSSRSMYIVNKQIEKIVRNIQDAHDKLLPLSLNPNIFITQDQIKKLHMPTFESIRESIETMQAFLKVQETGENSESLRKSEKSDQFSSLFHRFIDQTLTLFSIGAFPINQLNPHIIALANLHLMYFRMVKNPEIPIDKEFFLSTWSALNQLFLNMKGIIREIDFGCYPPQFDELYRILYFYVQNDQRAAPLAEDTGEALEALKRQLLFLNSVSEPTISILKDTKFVLTHYIYEFDQLKEYVLNQTRNLRPNDINQKAQINNQLRVIINSAISAFELIESATHIENIIQSPGFVFYNEIFEQPGLLTTVVQQAMDFISVEVRYLISAGVKANATHLIQLSKQVSESLRTGTLDNDSLKDFIRSIVEYDPSSDASERQIIQYCERALNTYLQGRDQPQSIIIARSHLENFKRARDKRIVSSETAYQKFWSLFLFQSNICDPNLQAFKDGNNMLYDYIHKNLVINALVQHLHDVAPLIEESIREINKSPFQESFRYAITKQKMAIDKLIHIISKWNYDFSNSTTKSQFIKLLHLFFQFCSVILKNAEKQAIVEGVTLMLSYFPPPSIVRESINLNASVSALSKQISKILGDFVLTNETTVDLCQLPIPSVDDKNVTEATRLAEVSLYDIRKLNMQIEDVVYMFKFINLYEYFYDNFSAKCGSQFPNNYSFTTIDSYAFNVSVDFITPMLHILGSPTIKTILNLNLLKHILDFFASMFCGDMPCVKSEIMSIVPLIPHLDFSEITYSAITNIPKIFIYLLSKESANQKLLANVMDLLMLYNIASTPIIASFVSGNVSEFKNESEVFLVHADSIDHEMGIIFRDIWSDVTFFASHITAVCNLANAMEHALSDDLPIQTVTRERQISKLHNCFQLNMYLSFSIAAQGLVERGIVSEESYADYENTLRIIANSRTSAFEDLPDRGFEYLKKFYFTLREQLFLSPTGPIESCGPSLVSKIAAVIADSKCGISKDTAEILKTITAKLHAIKSKEDRLQQESLCYDIKNSLILLHSIFKGDDRIVDCLKELEYVLETVSMIFNAQRFAFMVDLFLVRVACSMRLFVPEISMSPTIPSDELEHEPEEFPPISPFLQDYPQIKSKLNKLFEFSQGNDEVKNILTEISGEVNKVFEICLENSALGDNNDVKDVTERTKSMMEEEKSMRQELSQLMAKLQQLSQKENSAKQKEIDQLESAFTRLKSVTDSRDLVLDKIKSCEAETERMRQTKKEYEKMKERYLKSLSESETVQGENDKKEQNGDERVKIADPAVVEMSQQLTNLMDENNSLRKQLNEVRGLSKSQSGMTKIIVKEDISKLSEKRDLLKQEIASVKSEVIMDNEQRAIENDEKLFDSFDPIRIPLSDGKGFTPEVTERVEHLISLLFAAKHANDKIFLDATKIESLKKKDE